MVIPKTLNKWMRFVISPVKQNSFDLVQFFHSLKQFYKQLQSIYIFSAIIIKRKTYCHSGVLSSNQMSCKIVLLSSNKPVNFFGVTSLYNAFIWHFIEKYYRFLPVTPLYHLTKHWHVSGLVMICLSFRQDPSLAWIY